MKGKITAYKDYYQSSSGSVITEIYRIFKGKLLKKKNSFVAAK